MASSEDFVIDGKPLSELRVVDLKTHLEKRGLSKSGQKNVLVKRLRDHLVLERIHDAQAGKDPDAAPNMEMKSCGSNIVAEYLERQQQALQAAKKAAQAVRAASSSSFDDSDPNPSSRSPRGPNRSADEMSPPTHLVVKPPEADNNGLELGQSGAAATKRRSSQKMADASPNGGVEKPLDLSKEEPPMTSLVAMETTTTPRPEAKSRDDDDAVVKAKKEDATVVAMETTTTKPAPPPVQAEATTVVVVDQARLDETDSPRKSRSRSGSPASRSAGSSRSRSVSRSRSGSVDSSGRKKSASRSASVERMSTKSNEDLGDSKMSADDQQHESSAKDVVIQQQDNDDDEVEISAPQNAADEIMEAANVEEITVRRQSKEVSESQLPVEVMKKPERKRKWGSTTVSKRTTVSISSESLKEIVGPVSTTEATTTTLDEPVQLDYDDDEVPVSQPTQAKRIVISREDIDEEDTVEETNAQNSMPSKPDDKPQLVLAPTTESLADEYGIIREKSASPSRHTVGRMIHIRGLTRPFTVKILHELLGKFGNFNKEDFWIDTIKSHCFVTYNKEEDASFARQKLHNARWPSSNPFMLHVDFATQDDLDRFKNKPVVKKDASKQQQMSTVPPLISRENHVEINNSSKPKEQRVVREIRTNDDDVDEQRQRHGRKSPSPSSRDHDSKLWPKSREWDRGKEWKSGQSPPQPSGRKDESRRRRSPTPSRNRNAAAPNREEVPGKLLDDLFKKTKTLPHIYWLPLTSDQVVEKDKERKRRQQERADRLKKLEESEQRFRAERSRGGRHRR